MKRVVTQKRPDWKEHAESVGFKLHTMYGEPYWNEGVHYEFTLRQVEDDLEDPSTELHQMCLQAVEHVVNCEELMQKLQIPEEHWNYILDSWNRERHQNLYGRFDLVYDGNGPAKMLEYNADTPTSLYEAAAYQWMWLEESKQYGIVEHSADQFNSIEDRLIQEFSKYDKTKEFFFSSFDGVDEDYMTVEYMGYCAADGGLQPQYVAIQDISEGTDGQFYTKDGKHISQVFLLYPWEDMLLDDYSRLLKNTKTKFVEPAWKTILSNKGILPVLWEMFPGHPNLLPSYFAETGNYTKPFTDDKGIGDFVLKPIYSREGSSIAIHRGNEITWSDDDSYGHNNLVSQKFVELPSFNGNHPVIGTWIVGDECVGMGIREDENEITQDLSRFTPHTIIY